MKFCTIGWVNACNVLGHSISSTSQECLTAIIVLEKCMWVTENITINDLKKSEFSIICLHTLNLPSEDFESQRLLVIKSDKFIS